MRIVRGVAAVLSLFGLAISGWIYALTFFGFSRNNGATWPRFLQLGIFLLLLPIFALEYSTKGRTFFWKDFSAGKPKWLVTAVQVLALFFFVHFLLFLVQSHMAGPGIRNGQYVLQSHGRIIRAITESEYMKLKAAELRLFAAGWIFFYFVPTVYWWSPRDRRPATR